MTIGSAKARLPGKPAETMIRSQIPRILGELTLAITGIVVTAFVAPLIICIYWSAPFVSMPAVMMIAIFVSLTIGMVFSFPAALINGIVVSLAARLGIISLPIALVSGALIGRCTLSEFFNDPASISEQTTAFTATGALMGALYWLIAILPQPYMPWSEVAAGGVDNSAQGAIKQGNQPSVRTALASPRSNTLARSDSKRGRDRRVPWDGRIPPNWK